MFNKGETKETPLSAKVWVAKHWPEKKRRGSLIQGGVPTITFRDKVDLELDWVNLYDSPSN